MTVQTIIGETTADSTGGTGDDLPSGTFVEGHQLVDYDEIVDRNEELHLLTASHRLTVYARENQGAAGVVRGVAEVSASPVRQIAVGLSPSSTIEDTMSEFRTSFDDSIDLIGRAMSGVVYPPFLDTDAAGYGLGGAGSPGTDRVDLEGLPEEVARFHPRDELFLNGTIESSGFGGGEYMELQLQHLYGVSEQ